METATSLQSTMRNPERTAWGILLIAFAVFCLSCVLSVVVVHYFFFESAVPMVVEVQPSRGTGGLTGSDLSERVLRVRELMPTSRTTVRASSPSQIILIFRDPTLENRLIATVTLKDNTEADFVSAERPRFEWSNGVYRINLDNVYGKVEAFISKDLPRDIELNFGTKKSAQPGAAQGALVGFGDSGYYTFDVNEERVQVMNHSGETVLSYPSLRFGRSIPVGSRGVISNTDTDISVDDIQVIPNEMVNLLENSRFNDVVPIEQDNQVINYLPTGWSCGNEAGNMPRGNVITLSEDTQTVLQLVRGDGANTHGETFCKQGLSKGETWIDISAYNFLELRASLYIQYHSLGSCGERGSECPLMVRIDYLDINGGERVLFYGFFTTPDERYPPRCDSCWQDHIRVTDQAWYTFESGDIFAILPLEQRPSVISSVYFYASGHQYDTRIAEVSLIAGNVQKPVTAQGG